MYLIFCFLCHTQNSLRYIILLVFKLIFPFTDVLIALLITLSTSFVGDMGNSILGIIGDLN